MKIMRMCDLIKSQYTNSLLALRDTRIERYNPLPEVRWRWGVTKMCRKECVDLDWIEHVYLKLIRGVNFILPLLYGGELLAATNRLNLISYMTRSDAT